jgi:membrane protease YdiL (CAAX protease family)
MAVHNPWALAAIGLAQTAGVLVGFALLGALYSTLLRLALGRSREQWRELRVTRFWLVNMLLAPFMFLSFAGFIWMLRLTPSQVGLNLQNLGVSLGVSIPLAIVLGLPSALVAPVAVREGISPMRVPFGRTLGDVIGAITYVALFVGPLEEIPFRGIIQTELNIAMPQAWHVGRFSVTLGTFIAAIVFVLYHYRNVTIGGESNGQFVRLLPGRSIASIVLSLLFQGTGSLLGPILFHNIVDTFTVASFSIASYRRNGTPGTESALDKPEESLQDAASTNSASGESPDDPSSTSPMGIDPSK